MTRALVWTGFISIDGVVDSPGHSSEGHRSGGWVFQTPFDEAAYSLKGEELAETGALLFGRRSYEAFAPIWRDSEDHAAYRDLPKFVVSRTLQDEDLIDGWGATRILRSSDEVAELKRTDGGDIFIHGSAELARSLAPLIDRYHLLVFPVVLGDGKRVFPAGDLDARRFSVRESALYGNGVIKAVYTADR